MSLLKQGIGSSPFFILAIILLVAGFANILYNLFKATKSGNRKKSKNGEQTWVNRNINALSIISIIAIIIGLVYFIKWMSKIISG
jgi:uncharacterized membrane protein